MKDRKARRYYVTRNLIAAPKHEQASSYTSDVEMMSVVFSVLMSSDVWETSPRVILSLAAGRRPRLASSLAVMTTIA